MSKISTSNARLYANGADYAELIKRRTARGEDSAAALRQVAADLVQDIKTVRSAVKFKTAVDLIAKNVGRSAKKLMLADHRQLSSKRVMQISRTHADRQRFEIEQVTQGRRPFAKPPAGVDPPFDTLGYYEVCTRNARTAGLLDWVGRGLAATVVEGWPLEPTLRQMTGHLVEVCKSCASLRDLLNGPDIQVQARPAPTKKRRSRQSSQPSRSKAAFRPDRALGFVASVRGIGAKNVRDLPRLLRESPLTAADLAALEEGIDRLELAAQQLSVVVNRPIPTAPPRSSPKQSGSPERTFDVIDSRAQAVQVEEAQQGPDASKGTYIVIFKLDADATITVGKLGTFDFPAGYFGYIGSAFSSGGVRARTNRHCTPNIVTKFWNVDFLKPAFHALEEWWTNDLTKRECTWSAVLASLPGFGCPVAGFGSHDCPSIRAKGFGSPDGRLCQAHLVHSVEPPDVEDFADRLGLMVPGHAPVYWRRLERDEQGVSVAPETGTRPSSSTSMPTRSASRAGTSLKSTGSAGETGR